jgi:hypothetical protein
VGETGKRHERRLRQGWFDTFIRGEGIDIGTGGDPLTPTCRTWEVLDGDAQLMEGVEGLYDWVYSSHCLEHVKDPTAALHRWWELVKVGGHLVVVVPDEDLYEQRQWPSLFNAEHQSTWSLGKPLTSSWSPVHRSLSEELHSLPGGQVRSLQLCDEGYDYSLQGVVTAAVIVPTEMALELQSTKLLSGDHPPLMVSSLHMIDQTFTRGAEVSVEGIVRKMR